MSGLPLPPEADLTFWRDEVERADAVAQPYHGEWQENIDWYTGKSPDAKKALGTNSDYVNVNVDFYQVEQKLAALFYETPDLQLETKGTMLLVSQMPGQPGMPASPEQQAAIGQAHRALLNELLGDDYADVLQRAIHPAIKDCLAVSGTGPVAIGYEPTLRDVQPPEQFGSVLGLQQPVSFPIHEEWYATRFSPKKFLRPADFHGTDWDRAPWLGMRFRLPLTVAQKTFPALLADVNFSGTTTRDEYVLNEVNKSTDASGLKYVDGVAIWYRAAHFDPTASHPELYRELILIDGLEQPARHRDSPHQEIDQKTGRLTADSLIGNPIHPLSIRSVPDSSFVPSDSQMTRPLVRELCQFRTDMVQERDSTRPRTLYDASKLPPEVVRKIEDGSIGDLIAVEEGTLAQGIGAIMAVVTQGTSPRQTFVANDYITRDIEKTLAIDASGAGASDGQNESATKSTIVDRNRSVRLNHEQRQVLRWYLKLVDKFSALVCRYMTPQLAVPYIGQQAAQIWGMWDKKATDGRMAFTARADSQIKLDAASERKFAMDLYQFLAKDPNVNRVELVKNLVVKAGLDPSKVVVEQLPDKKPDPNLGIAFKGEDLGAPWADQVREVLAQLGIQISPAAVQAGATQMFQQMALGVRDASGKAVPPVHTPAEHGGPADQVRPLSKQKADQSGNRSGAPAGGAQ